MRSDRLRCGEQSSRRSARTSPTGFRSVRLRAPEVDRSSSKAIGHPTGCSGPIDRSAILHRGNRPASSRLSWSPSSLSSLPVLPSFSGLVSDLQDPNAGADSGRDHSTSPTTSDHWSLSSIMDGPDYVISIRDRTRADCGSGLTIRTERTRLSLSSATPFNRYSSGSVRVGDVIVSPSG